MFDMNRSKGSPLEPVVKGPMPLTERWLGRPVITATEEPVWTAYFVRVAHVTAALCALANPGRSQYVPEAAGVQALVVRTLVIA